MEWWEVKTGPREGEQGRWRRKWGNANQMLARGTVKKNRLSREPGAGLLLGRAGRAGTDVWRKERKKGKKKEEKSWNEIHSPGGRAILQRSQARLLLSKAWSGL